jgi:hypothetical protein
MIVGEGVAAPLVDLALTAVVAEEYDEMWSRRNPILVGQQLVDARTDRGILDDEDVAALQVALGRCR